MKTIGIIPARFASTRFPGKPLIDLGGKTMIQRVYEQALKADLDEVIIATDHAEIAQHAEAIGAKYCLTSAHHPSGTDRCAEVSQLYPAYDLVINIQGDEPFIDPEQINLVKKALLQPNAQISTLIKPIKDQTELFNENTPKVVINEQREAIYFSRQTIPFLRNVKPSEWLNHFTYYKHIGIYGFRRETLQELTQLAPHPIEQAESLEQLRWIANGYKIATAVTQIETLAVDSPEDVIKIKKAYKLNSLIGLIFLSIFSFSCGNNANEKAAGTEKFIIPDQAQIEAINSNDSTLNKQANTLDSSQTNKNTDPSAHFTKSVKKEFSKLGELDEFRVSVVGPKASETSLIFEIFSASGAKLYQAKIPGREILKTNPNLKSEPEKFKYLKKEAEFFFDEEHFMIPAVMPEENADENVPDKSFHQELKNTKLPGFYYRDGEESTVYIAWSSKANQMKIYYRCCKK